jgi:hypothetical protein
VLPHGAPALRGVCGFHYELLALELVQAGKSLADQGANEAPLDVVREGVRALVDLESAERRFVAALRVLLRPCVRGRPPDGVALESVAMTKSKDATPNDRCFFMLASSYASLDRD